MKSTILITLGEAMNVPDISSASNKVLQKSEEPREQAAIELANFISRAASTERMNRKVTIGMNSDTTRKVDDLDKFTNS